MNSLPTEGIKSIAVLDGAAVLLSGYRPGLETIDIRTKPVEIGPDSNQVPLTYITVLRGPNQQHISGITISKNGPYKSKLRAILGIISSPGYLPRADYEAHYYGLTTGFKLGRYPVELSGYRYRGRGEYTVFDWYLSQSSKFSRDLLCFSAKTEIDISVILKKS